MDDVDSLTSETVAVDNHKYAIRIGGVYPVEIMQGESRIGYISTYELQFPAPHVQWEAMAFLRSVPHEVPRRLRIAAVDVYRRTERECDQ